MTFISSYSFLRNNEVVRMIKAWVAPRPRHVAPALEQLPEDFGKLTEEQLEILMSYDGPIASGDQSLPKIKRDGRC